MKQKFTMPDGEVLEKDMPVWKTPYNHDTNFESDRTALYCADPSLTKQEFKEETDINFLLERFMQTKELPPVVLPEHFMDNTQQPTYFEMQTKLAAANSLFYQQPASVRSEFLNDPARFADAVITAMETGNKEWLEDLGIEFRKPEEGDRGTPRTAATPAPNVAQEPSKGPTGAKATEKPEAKATETVAKSENA